ncbi:hypothetical protein SAMN05192563_1003192 [Paraburkholderia aspalathi]|uniref:Uncharacterized protein n=1 Tax=Paraburkholderia aspalathi TaxID=1324617 RepID=A0A1I7A9K5_9BURK|nr:hypothetical protein SAMN05192563_1003192 [Paraburkholderia aspalathi]
MDAGANGSDQRGEHRAVALKIGLPGHVADTSAGHDPSLGQPHREFEQECALMGRLISLCIEYRYALSRQIVGRDNLQA